MDDLSLLLNKSKPSSPFPRPVDLTPEEYLAVRQVLLIARAASKQKDLEAYLRACAIGPLVADVAALAVKLAVSQEEIARQYLARNAIDKG